MTVDASKSFLGTGWSFPPSFSRAALGVAMVSDGEDIRQSLHILLSTELGERLLVPLYGTQLARMMFQGLTTTLINELREIVEQAIIRWEPRIIVERIEVIADPNVAGLVRIAIDYTVSLTNTRDNIVFPFYAQEASLIPQSP